MSVLTESGQKRGIPFVYERSTSCIRGIILRTTFHQIKDDQKRAHSFYKNIGGMERGKNGYLPTKKRR